MLNAATPSVEVQMEDNDGPQQQQQQQSNSALTNAAMPSSDPAGARRPFPALEPQFKRKLGGNEMFSSMCHDRGNLNVMCGLTLLTRTAVDEGLLKCALQEFQHMHPQLTSRIRKTSKSHPSFLPMECPILPLDSTFECQDMLHQRFDTENGPLWRVQLVTEATMERANLAFGPEVEAILEDDSSASTRWRYFLRYFQGNVNGRDIPDFDDEEEGFRSFILMSFHPAVTDTFGVFYLMRRFLQILDAVLDEQVEAGDRSAALRPDTLHESLENLLPSGESSMQMGDLFKMGKVVADWMMARKSPWEPFQIRSPRVKTDMIRGWLDEEHTTELSAMLEEDDASLHGVMLAAGLIAVSRVLQVLRNPRAHPDRTMNLRGTNESNLRQYCPSAPKNGCLTTYYEADYVVPPITDRTDFWRFAHELTVKHNAAKGNREPLRLLRVYNKMLGEENPLGNVDKVRNEMGVAVYGDLGSLFRRGESVETAASSSATQAAFQSLESSQWDRPLSRTKRNIRLEDTFHMTAAQDLGSPFTHTAHILYGKLNYILLYHTSYADQTQALKVRDEVIDVLRMATAPQRQTS